MRERNLTRRGRAPGGLYATHDVYCHSTVIPTVSVWQLASRHLKNGPGKQSKRSQ